MSPYETMILGVLMYIAGCVSAPVTRGAPEANWFYFFNVVAAALFMFTGPITFVVGLVRHLF